MGVVGGGNRGRRPMGEGRTKKKKKQGTNHEACLKKKNKKKETQIPVNFEETSAPSPSPSSSVSSFQSARTHEDDYEEHDGKLPNTLAELFDGVAEYNV